MKNNFDPTDPLNLVDETLSKEMARVDWRALTMPESQTLSISLGMIHRAETFRQTASLLTTYSSTLTLAVLVLMIVGKLTNLSANVIQYGVVLSLLINVAHCAWLKRASKQDVQAQRATILEEVKDFAERHPLVNRFVTPEYPIDIEDFNSEVDEEET